MSLFGGESSVLSTLRLESGKGKGLLARATTHQHQSGTQVQSKLSLSLSRQHAIIKHDLTCPDCGRSADAKNICVRTFKRLLTISAKHSNRICHHFSAFSKPWARVHIEIIISVKLQNFSNLVILVLLFVSST